ncbi:MAG: accessory factor UbiK family protein [Cellvibrionaceae bacterium]
MITAIIDEVLKRTKNNEGATDQSQLRALLNSVLEKMDIVSRAEFDAQAAVLQRTREKITALEQQLSALEEEIK